MTEGDDGMTAGLSTFRTIILHAAGLILAASVAAGLSATVLGVQVLPFAFVVALLHAIILGLPIYLVRRVNGRPRWRTALKGGFAAGAIPIGFFGLALVFQEGLPGYLSVVAMAGGLGAAGGLAFGLTVRSTLPPDPTEDVGAASYTRRRFALDATP